MTKAEIFQENLQIERVVLVHSLSEFLLRKFGIQTVIGIGLSVSVRQKFSIILITWEPFIYYLSTCTGKWGLKIDIFAYFQY